MQQNLLSIIIVSCHRLTPATRSRYVPTIPQRFLPALGIIKKFRNIVAILNPMPDIMKLVGPALESAKGIFGGAMDSALGLYNTVRGGNLGGWGDGGCFGLLCGVDSASFVFDPPADLFSVVSPQPGYLTSM